MASVLRPDGTIDRERLKVLVHHIVPTHAGVVFMADDRCKGAHFEHEMTVADLQPIVAAWPVAYADGEPTVVLITHCPDLTKPWQRVSNAAYEVGAIDNRDGIGNLYFGPRDYEGDSVPDPTSLEIRGRILTIGPDRRIELTAEVVSRLIDKLNDAATDGAPWPIYEESQR